MKEGSHFVDSQVYANLNMTEIGSKIAFTGVNNRPYITVEITDAVETARQYTHAFTFIVTSEVQRRHLSALSTSITSLWQEKPGRAVQTRVKLNPFTLQTG